MNGHHCGTGDGLIFASSCGQWHGMLFPWCSQGTHQSAAVTEFSADLMCHVVGLADAYEVILGEDWFGKYSATLSWGNRCYVLAMGS